MTMTDREARLVLGIFALLSRPRLLTGEDKKRRGLKYCRFPGYGFRWFRGQRVPDQGEREVIAQVVERRGAGHSWYAIAAELLRQRVRTADGREWSVAHCRRAFGVELHRRAASGG
jgi:hypothetical protein